MKKGQHLYFNKNNLISPKKLSKVAMFLLLLVPLIFYGWRINLRPMATEFQETLHPDLTYQRKVYSVPRPHIVNMVTVDLGNGRIKPFVTPPESGNTLAMKTSKFIREYDLDLAINGSFFYPFSENTPWDYSPHP